MNRTDRLYAIAEELRRSGDRGRTSTSLAEQFEVSTRTIKRDVTALQQSGLPIWGEGRPGGGYRMRQSQSTLAPIGFTVGEAVAIAAALETTIDLPFAPDGQAALSKLLWAMNADERRQVDDVFSRVWVTGSRQRSSGARVLDEAVRLRRVVTMTYVDGDGTETRRSVEPLQFAFTGGSWYLMGYCRLREAGRWFRLDRIGAVSLTSEVPPRRDVEELFGTIPDDARQVAFKDA